MSRVSHLRIDIEVLKSRLQTLLGEDYDAEIFQSAIESETDFFEIIARALRDALQREAMAEALSAMMAKNTDRRNRLLNGAENIREAVRDLLQRTEIHKRVYPDMTVSLNKLDKAIERVDFAQLPEEYVRVRTMPDTLKIREDLKAGKDIPGVTLSEGDRYSLVIRQK